MNSMHIVSAFDGELAYVVNKIGAMGGQAERMVELSVQALINADSALARRVVADDLLLDEAERDIGDKAIALIGRRQPLASDLRQVIGAIRISADLERVGDLGKNIAKRAIAISRDNLPISLNRGLESLAELALLQLKDVLDAYASGEIGRLAQMRDRDEQIDLMYTSLFRQLLTHMMEDVRRITPCTHMLFCAKNIERIGDHATNIAETIYYIQTGRQMPADRPKEDRTPSMVVET
ncbi:phosphate transport system regulatory protein PhoU [Salmonella enterica subsp. enterica]|nr:phosphate transport system regulatory protein PhoU [Salmonella enterica subsp. enterica serovar Enteritidis]